MGLLRAKAQITAGVADWPTYLGVIAQATAVGGSLLFALATTWVFGREFVDRTAKLLLAVPTPRHVIVSAKFMLAAAWSALLSGWILAVALPIGFLLDLPGWSGGMLRESGLSIALTAGLSILLLSPTAFLASASRGYLAPLGFAILTIFLGQITVATGWGAWFPWSVPALFSGMAGPRAAALGASSYVLVGLTSLAGGVATFVWWRQADHTGSEPSACHSVECALLWAMMASTDDAASTHSLDLGPVVPTAVVTRPHTNRPALKGKRTATRSRAAVIRRWRTLLAFRPSLAAPGARGYSPGLAPPESFRARRLGPNTIDWSAEEIRA